VRAAARLLKISEKKLYQWIEQGKLPAYRVQDQYRFNRVELLEWATAQRLNISPDIFRESASDGPLPSLAEALQAGGVHPGLEGRTREEILRAVVACMRLPEAVDRDFLFRVLQAREELGSTGVGDGIAVPHVRNPLVLHVTQPLITLCFPSAPVDFGALDGKPVHALFTLVSPTVHSHLHMLSRLGFVMRDKAFRTLLRRQASEAELLTVLRRIESSLPGNGQDGAPR